MNIDGRRIAQVKVQRQSDETDEVEQD